MVLDNLEVMSVARPEPSDGWIDELELDYSVDIVRGGTCIEGWKQGGRSN